ncbi:MAG: hypothetical protein C5B51_22910 [Terriglobia bacterium]|nr:MAG: hypothetical protein C5B51_22910 [Terriglobia bacterium]
MDLSAVQRSVQPLVAATPVAPLEHSAENREVIQAVKALNATEMFGEENELVFQLDRQVHRIVVRVVNRKTQEVVSQVPPEYILRLHEDLLRRRE